LAEAWAKGPGRDPACVLSLLTQRLLRRGLGKGLLPARPLPGWGEPSRVDVQELLKLGCFKLQFL